MNRKTATKSSSAYRKIGWTEGDFRGLLGLPNVRC